jgi:opacity protein-like surface antigen
LGWAPAFHLLNEIYVFSSQIMLGCGLKVSEKMNIDVSYRYFATDDPTFDTVETEVSSHNILAGVRVTF